MKTLNKFRRLMVVALVGASVFAAMLMLESQSASGFTLKGERAMTTPPIVEGYFAAVKAKQEWQSFFADDLVFTSFTSPVKTIDGKAAFLESTNRFYASIDSFELRDVLVDSDKACVLTRYQLKGPNGNAFQSDVAEVFTTKDNKISSFSIYFDSAPFPK
jgi:ketosteroid isomerase-like protein